MKIAVVSSTYTGGAGIAARRIHEALLHVGEDSTFFFKHGELDQVEASVVIDSDDVCFDILDWFAHDFDQENRLPGNAILSLPYPPVAPHFIEGHMAECDLLNLHWISGIMSPESMAYAASKGKRIVWTLHDENPFTAVCHYRNGCDGYLNGCENCPQVKPQYHDLVKNIYLAKEKFYPKDMTIVAPSKWLADQAAKSPLLGGRRVEVIKNGLDTSVFTDTIRIEARKRFRIAESDKVILCGALTFEETRKGWEYLCTALRLMAENNVAREDIKILTFGETPEDELPFTSIRIGRCDDMGMIASAYAAADVAVISSVEDNLPNIMLEALSCGTPVVGFPTGGMPDIIRNGKTGYLTSGFDTNELAGRISDALSGSINRLSCRAYAEGELSLAAAGRAYRDLFTDVVAKPLTHTLSDIPAMSSEARQVFAYSAAFAAEHVINQFNLVSIYKKSTLPNLIELLNVLAAGKKIVLFGTKSINAQVFADVFKGISYAVDNNEDLHGSLINGVLVKNPVALASEPEDSCIVLVFVRDSAPVLEQLRSLGIKNDQIIVCV